jgi:hypothetical protein
MTALACSQFCAAFQYFGTEWSRECYCGNIIAPNTVAADGECHMPCTGDASEICGDGDHINIYTNGAYTEPSVTVVAGLTYRGCREEPGEHRDLPDANFKQADMSPQVCDGLCAGYL